MEGIQISRSILLAVDDSENAARAVDYVASIISHGSGGFQVTLLHIIRQPEAGSFATDAEKDQHLDALRKRAIGFLSGYRERLVASGMPEHAVRIRCLICYCPSIAEGILAERDQSEYSTIVVGRHHLTRAEEFLYGSVSGRLINHASNCAVWVIA